MSDNIQNLAIGLILLDAQAETELTLEEEIVVALAKPADLQTEEQLLSWNWIKADDTTWVFIQ